TIVGQLLSRSNGDIADGRRRRDGGPGPRIWPANGASARRLDAFALAPRLLLSILTTTEGAVGAPEREEGTDAAPFEARHLLLRAHRRRDRARPEPRRRHHVLGHRLG